LKREKAAPLLIALMALSLSIVGALAAGDDEDIAVTKIGSAYGFVFNAGGVSLSGGAVNPCPINSSTRSLVYSYVLRNPGVHFRGVCGGLGLSVGVIQYHLGQLASAGLLVSCRDRRYKRFFETGRFTEEEMKVLSAMRNDTSREILSTLLEVPRMAHCELASSLGVSSPAVTWQMGRLKAINLVEAENDRRRVSYAISGEHRSTVKEFLDIFV